MFTELAGGVGVAVLLGMRHGLDADHLATVDALTRARTDGRGRPEACGLWFSIGHGGAVMALAVAFAALGKRLAPPLWLESSGLYIAACALVALGLANLLTALRASTNRGQLPVSVKRWVFRRLQGRLSSSTSIVGLGVLFAMSLDAVGLAVLFATFAATLETPWAAAALGGAFAFGMATVDGLVGLGSAWLLRHSHALAPDSPRVSATLLGLGCLITAAALLSESVLTRTADFSESQALLLSAGVALTVPMSYLVARWLSLRAGRAGLNTEQEQLP